MAKFAELLIRLGANTASLQQDFARAHKQAENFAEGMKHALEGIGVGLSIAGIAESIKSLVDYEHEMGDAAKATGMTVEQVSGFAYALKSVGVPLDQLQLGLAQFDKIVSGLMRSKAGSDAIKELGLSMKKLKTEGTHQALLDVADAFKKIPDGAQKAGIASALFTSTLSQKLIPLLDEGSAGILALEKEAKKLGVTLTEQDVQKADAAYQSFIRLDAAWEGAKISLGNVLLPALTTAAELFSGNEHAIRAVTDSLKEMFLEAEKISTYLNPVTWFTGGHRDVIQKQIDQLATDELIARQDMANHVVKLGAFASSQKTPLPVNTGNHQTRQHIDRVAESIKNLKEQLTGLSQGSVAAGLDRLKNLGANSSQLSQGKYLLDQIQWLKTVKQEQEAHNEALRQYKSITDSLTRSLNGELTPLQEYQETMQKLLVLQLKGVDASKGMSEAHELLGKNLMKSMLTPSQLGIGVPQGGLGNASALWNQILPPLSKFTELDNKARELGQTMQSSFIGMIESGQGFTKILQGLTTQLANFLLKSIVFKQIAGMFGTTGFGGVIGSFFSGLAGARAAGGPVTAGSLYLVGEQGPELFSPGSSGSIVPNSALASVSRASGGNTYIDARGADAGVEARVMRALARAQKQAGGQSLVSVYEYQARGGTL